jgi:LmbE family N-acetylglucosaminyl deacetylase
MLDLKRFRTVLVFFAHPDDETLAAGGFMAKLSRSGAEVHVAIPATGVHSRRNVEKDAKNRENALTELQNDCRQALALLGIAGQNIHLGHFPDNEMDSH